MCFPFEIESQVFTNKFTDYPEPKSTTCWIRRANQMDMHIFLINALSLSYTSVGFLIMRQTRSLFLIFGV